MAGVSRLRAHVVFSQSNAPTFTVLADLLSIIFTESVDYRLFSVCQSLLL